jgi:hypothetical protein
MLKDSIELGKDIVKIVGLGKDYDKFVTVTKIKPEKKGIEITGVIVEDGIPKEETFFIKATEKEGTLSMNIIYRKFTTDKVEYIAANPPKLEGAYIVKSKDGMPLSPELVYDYIEIGSLIKYTNSSGKIGNSTVKGVLPGKIALTGEKFPINYNRIIEFNTTKLSKDDLKD